MTENIEEICFNHVSSRDTVMYDGRDKRYEYCYGCRYDEKNKECPHYTKVRLWRVEIQNA